VEQAINNSESMGDRRLYHRRTFSRAAFKWPVTIVSKSQTLQGRIKDISRGGALVYLPKNLKLNEKIRIAVEITDCSDVLTAEGEVLRITTLDSLVDDRYGFSAAIQFTDISPEDLKYFSGNLAPEWHYLESAPEQPEPSSVESHSPQKKLSHTSHNSMIAAVSVAGIVCIGLLLYFLSGSENGGNEEIAKQIKSLDERYSEIQLQLRSLQTSAGTIENIGKQIQRMDDQIIRLKDQLASISTSIAELAEKPPSYPAKDQVDDNEVIAVLSNNSPSKNLVSVTPEFYEVKKGETLYRISVKHSISVNGLRELNNLTSADKIYPGQKLKIK